MKKLIKITSEHYVVIDEKVNPMDFVLQYPNKNIIQVNQSTCVMYDLKITHSTKPVEQYYSSSDGTVPFVYHKIQQLNLSEVEELVNGYSANKIIENINPDINNYSYEQGFVDGFKAHQELTKDNFSLKEIEGAFKELSKPQYKFDTKTTFKDLLYKQRKTEWLVDFDENGKLKLV